MPGYIVHTDTFFAEIEAWLEENCPGRFAAWGMVPPEFERYEQQMLAISILDKHGATITNNRKNTVAKMLAGLNRHELLKVYRHYSMQIPLLEAHREGMLIVQQIDTDYPDELKTRFYHLPAVGDQVYFKLAFSAGNAIIEEPRLSLTPAPSRSAA